MPVTIIDQHLVADQTIVAHRNFAHTNQRNIVVKSIAVADDNFRFKTARLQ